jgi:hypothetical protein
MPVSLNLIFNSGVFKTAARRLGTLVFKGHGYLKLKTSNRNWNKNQQILLLQTDYV